MRIRNDEAFNDTIKPSNELIVNIKFLIISLIYNFNLPNQKNHITNTKCRRNVHTILNV